MGGYRSSSRKGRLVKGHLSRRLARSSVGARKPVANVKQVPHGGDRISLMNGSVAVDSSVAQGVDQPGLAEDRIARCVLQGRFVDQGAEVVLVGAVEGAVVPEGPVEGQLEGPPRIE